MPNQEVRMSITRDVFEYVCQNPNCTRSDIFREVSGAERSVPVVEMQWGFCRKCIECLQRFHKFKNENYYQNLKTRNKWDSDTPSKQTLLVIAFYGSENPSWQEYAELTSGLSAGKNFVRQVYCDCRTILTILTTLGVME